MPSATTNQSYCLHIKSLTGAENYATWSVQMEDILSEHIADGTTSSKATWKAADCCALMQIRLCVAPHLIVDVQNAKTTLEAWTTLKEYYQSDSGIAIILAIQK